MIENVMVLGVSNFHHRWRLNKEFLKVYPRVLNREGKDLPITHAA